MDRELLEQRRRHHDLRVARVIEETADAKSFVFEVPEDLRAAFEYKAGQFLTFDVEVDGQKLVRCYSLASSPEVDREWKVTVKRVEDGRVSNFMNDSVSEGDVMSVLPPTGIFCLQEEERDLLLFAGGSGITPVIAIAKTALAGSARRIKLIYANRDADSIIFRDELAELVSRHANRFEVVHRLDVEHGFMSEADAAGHARGWEEAEAYLCGPGPFMETGRRALAAAGFPEARVHLEIFESPPDPHEPTLEEVAAQAASAPAEGDVPSTLTVTLDGKTRQIPYTEGETVLQAVRIAGLQAPFSCEDGYCGCCMAKVTEGEVQMRRNDCLTQSDLDEGWRLTCQSVPTSGKISVDYDG